MCIRDSIMSDHIIPIYKIRKKEATVQERGTYMIGISFNKRDFEYDAYTLVKAFYPQEEVENFYTCLLYTSRCV